VPLAMRTDETVLEMRVLRLTAVRLNKIVRLTRSILGALLTWEVIRLILGTADK